jgi:drug/metabolite transporter (DMT)-like permease
VSDPALAVGIVMMVISMCCDAAVSNVQEQVFLLYQTPTAELIMRSKLCAFCLASIMLLFSGTFLQALQHVIEHPVLVPLLIAYGILGCTGEFFVMALIRQYGGLVAVVVTSLRKIMNVVLSFLVIPKQVTGGFIMGMAVVFIGMCFEAYAKNQKKLDLLASKWMRKLSPKGHGQ